MTTPSEIIKKINSCPLGSDGWRTFEDIGIEALTYLFVPPLTQPNIQVRTISGIDRRDAVFPNRNLSNDNYWGQLYQELHARLILVEFKNYDHMVLGKDEVDQTRNYLTKPFGKLGIICCRKEPSKEALQRRNQVYTQEEKVLIFVTDEILCEMIRIKERGEDPAKLILEMIEYFYMTHE